MTATINKQIWSAGARNFNFEVYTAFTPFKSVQGIYIMAQRDGMYWVPLYIGEALDLDKRVGSGLLNHEKWAAAAHRGASHIHVMVTQGDRSNRLAIETALRNRYDPPFNRQ